MIDRRAQDLGRAVTAGICACELSDLFRKDEKSRKNSTNFTEKSAEKWSKRV